MTHLTTFANQTKYVTAALIVQLHSIVCKSRISVQHC
jgi:hypothetical protein